MRTRNVVGATAALAFAIVCAYGAGWQDGRHSGLRVQFCVDHAGQWDVANGRCLKTADTITVEVKP
jgi:hypothetical protein